MTPTGDEMLEAAEFMAAAIPSSRLVAAVVGGQAERTMLALPDESKDFGNRRILSGQRLHRIQPLGKDAGAVKQFLVERALSPAAAW